MYALVISFRAWEMKYELKNLHVSWRVLFLQVCWKWNELIGIQYLIKTWTDSWLHTLLTDTGICISLGIGALPVCASAGYFSDLSMHIGRQEDLCPADRHSSCCAFLKSTMQQGNAIQVHQQLMKLIMQQVTMATIKKAELRAAIAMETCASCMPCQSQQDVTARPRLLMSLQVCSV